MGIIRRCFLLIAARMLLASGIVHPLPGSVLVVTESGVAAFADAVDGLTGVLGATTRVIDIQSVRSAAGLAEALRSRDTQLVIAVGSRAFAEVQSRKSAVPVVSTMMLHGAAMDAAGQMNVDLPLNLQFAAVRTLLPRVSRVGIIRNPAHTRLTHELLETQARKEGYTAVVEECDSPAKLLKTVASLRNRADLLLCLPDPDLYNSVTIQPLVMAAIEYRLPVFGFSPAFVRAGAAAGVYPDYRALGRQTAELVLRLLKNESKPEGPLEEYPSKVQIAVNQRVVRLLGLDFHLPNGVEVFR